MSDDLIRRSDAINALKSMLSDDINTSILFFWQNQTVGRGIDKIKNLPSADRPQGEWKFVGSSIEMIWECPFCGEHTFGFEEHLPNYCGNCGADMRKGVDV